MGIFEDFTRIINNDPNQNLIEHIVTGLSNGKSLESSLFTWDQEEDVSEKSANLISMTQDNLIILVENPLPKFFTYKNRVRDALIKSSIHLKNIEILVKKQDGKKEMPDYFKEICNSIEEGRKKEKIYTERKVGVILDRNRIENDSLRYDCFIIVDKKNIFWGKPSFNETKFIFSAPWLGKKLYSEIESLGCKYNIK